MRKLLLIASLLMLFVFRAFAVGIPYLIPDYDRDGVIDKFDFNRVDAAGVFDQGFDRRLPAYAEHDFWGQAIVRRNT